MELVSNKRCKVSSSSDAFPSGESTGPVGRPSVDRVYPTGMGLRPKACPQSRNATFTTTRDDRPIQGPVDRCLTLVRAMNPDITGDDRADPADPVDTLVDVQDIPTTDPSRVGQESIGFLKLHHLFIFRQSKKGLLAASR